MTRNTAEEELMEQIRDRIRERNEIWKAMSSPNQRVPKLCCECNNQEIKGECVYCGN